MVFERNRRVVLHIFPAGEMQNLIRGSLEKAGFFVLEAASPAEIFQELLELKADNSHPEILGVILDVPPPGTSAEETIGIIRGIPALAGMPIVQISATLSNSKDDLFVESSALNAADAYVSESVQPREFLQILNTLIRSSEAERNLRFQVAVGDKLTASFDYDHAIDAIEKAFLPDFADECFVCLRAPSIAQTLECPALACSPDCLPETLYPIARQVSKTGESHLVDPSTLIVPLKAGLRCLGSLVFLLRGDSRRYTREAVALAEDLAARAALALQNAFLLGTQRATQAALVQSEKLAAAGRLSAAIAHEINNPLEAITNLIFLIDTQEGISPVVKRYAEEALSEISRLTHIARKSLGFYRELTGPATFDLNESVEETLNIYLKRFEAKHIGVERNYTQGLMLFAIKGEIRQVISNLLVNAYDVLPEYGMLRVETAGSGDQVCFRVADNGQGIPEDILPRIFEPFYTTKEDTGNGLGLWVSDTIVQKHGGRIEVESATEEKHRGTTFTVTLPRIAPKAA